MKRLHETRNLKQNSWETQSTNCPAFWSHSTDVPLGGGEYTQPTVISCEWVKLTKQSRVLWMKCQNICQRARFFWHLLRKFCMKKAREALFYNIFYRPPEIINVGNREIWAGQGADGIYRGRQSIDIKSSWSNIMTNLQTCIFLGIQGSSINQYEQVKNTKCKK